MFTILIIGIIATIICFRLSRKIFNFEPFTTVVVFMISILLSVFSFVVSEAAYLPDNYETVESLAYVTEQGTLEIKEGPFFTAGKNYYETEPGLAVWIPFYPCEYVEVEFPERAVVYNAGVRKE